MKELTIIGECKYLVKINNKDIQYKTLPSINHIVIDDKLIYYLVHHDNLYEKCHKTLLLNADISITNRSNEKKENIYLGLFHNRKNIIKNLINKENKCKLEKCNNGFYIIKEKKEHSTIKLKACLKVNIYFRTPKIYTIDANYLII